MKIYINKLCILLTVVSVILQEPFFSFAEEVKITDDINSNYEELVDENIASQDEADEIQVVDCDDSLDVVELTEESENNEETTIESNSDSEELLDSQVSLEIISQPQNAIGYIGNDIYFEVGAQGEDLSYSWYYSYDDGEIWRKCKYYVEVDSSGNKTQEDYVGANTNRLEMRSSKIQMQNIYKCIVSDVNGKSVESNVVRIEPGKPVVENQSEREISFDASDDLELFVEARGIDLRYRWYESSDSGKSWVKNFDEGYATNKIILNKLDRKYDGKKYYCLITDRYSEQCSSEIITLSFKNKSSSELKILEQPVNAIGYIGNDVSFEIKVQGEKLNYTWYYSYDNGVIWRKCKYYTEIDSNGNKIQVDYEGVNTNKLEMHSSKIQMQNIFKCIVTDGSGKSIESNVVCIEPGKPVVVQQSEEVVNFNETDNIELYVEAQGIDLRYRWYESKDSGKTWIKNFNEGYATNRLYLKNVSKSYDGKIFYCLVTDRYGEQVQSNNIRLIYKDTAGFKFYNNREIVTYEKDILFNHEALFEKCSVSPNNVTFNINYDSLPDDVILLGFSAKSNEKCELIEISVNEDKGTYLGRFPVQIYEEDYIIPIVGLNKINTISISSDSATNIEVGNFELCNLGKVNIANYQTGIIAVDKPSTEVDLNSGVGFMATDSAVFDNRLYTVHQGFLTIYDITNPNNPSVVGSLAGLGETRDIAVTNNGQTLIIACRTNGINIVDISDSSNPFLIRNIETMGLATSVAVGGNYIFATTRRHGLVIYDISDLMAPRFCSQISYNQEEFYGCCLSDGYLYVSSWAEQKVHVFNVENVCAPEKIATINTDGNPAGCTVEGGKLYTATGYNSSGVRKVKTDMNYGMGNGLEIYDVTNPESPRLLSISKIDGRYLISGFDHWRVAVAGNIAYVSNAYNGVYIYDVSNPSAPDRIEKITVNIPKTSNKYKVVNNDKYLFTYNQELYAQSIVTSVTPINGKIYITTNTGDLLKSIDQLSGKKTRNGLYVLDRDYALTSSNNEYSYYGNDNNEASSNIDIKGYDVTVIPTIGNAQSVAMAGDKLYVAEGVSGAYIYRLDDFSAKKIADTKTVVSLLIIDDYLYISEAGQGIKVYHLVDDELAFECEYTIGSGDSINNLHASPDNNYIIGQKGLYDYVVFDVSEKTSIKLDASINTGGMYCRSITTDSTNNEVFGLTNRNEVIFYKVSEDGKANVVNRLTNSFYMEDGGITGYKDYVVQMAYKGYIYYNPETMTNNLFPSVKRIIISDYNVKGIPKIVGDIMFVTDSIGKKVTLVDISNINKPKVIQQIDVAGNPDEVYVKDETIIIPLNYNGVMILKGESNAR